MTVTSGEVETQQRFSESIKAASWQVHEHAEGSVFMQRLLSGEASIDEYARLVAQYHAIYAALETAGAHMSADPVAGAFAVPELARLAALEADLEVLLGPDWSASTVPLPSTQRYVERIDDVCRSWPGGFVAHHYVRYLGDLSGGQIIRRILKRTYDIAGDDGVRFYIFDRIDNGVQFKKRYRQLLDEAPWGAAERERIIDEVIAAFVLNADVLDELSDQPSALA